MGQALVHRCDSLATEVQLGADCSSCVASAQRRRLEELILEVEDARQENRNLTRNASRLRNAINDLASDGQQGQALGGDYDCRQRLARAAPQADRALGDEKAMLQLKRALKELQTENTMLKQTQAHSSGTGRGAAGRGVGGRGAGGRGAGGRGASSGGAVPLSAYEALRVEVEELQRAHEAAQADRLQQQAVSGLQSRDGQLLASSYMPAAPPGRYPGSSAYGSTRVSGSAYASTRTSGAGTPGLPTPSGGGGCYSDAGAVDSGEVRRQVQAMQLENEQLRRKVRMLAAS